ncbi:glycoside hydrolase family 43 protein [Microbulbifer harenosus]|uniref:Glycoside hydrolase n=1 Tax=Microbulbifer harenosus TaxID=2576840 RepID=A0ABY2UHL5_9GAMM|nr:MULTISPECIES: glycoside hydrolase family 43 protein [Microbulbifer]QIL91332.1 family 43 glycosylhydrolase [Microbulbifer sp. SH-1]TLM77244.1 glycoside hydrolase [Microbulbifer harenosus]
MRKQLISCLGTLGLASAATTVLAANPIITDVLTADPAAMVHDGTVYLYTGHDEAKDNKGFYEMHKWLLFTSTDMVNWKNEGSPLAVKDFKWARGDAWASHVVEKDGKFYFYTTVRHDESKPGFAIGVAVSDNPRGPFKDALGRALISNDMTTDTEIDWDDLDPAAFIDDNGEAYLFWGNTKPRWAKLKDNMIELDGPIHSLDLPNFTEALYAHKHGDYYYLTYAMGFPEKIGYAMSKSIEGPWEYKGILNELAGNSNTNHQSVIDYKGRSFFIYHNGGTPEGGSFRRSVCIDDLHYNEDGTIKRVVMTSEGVAPVK